MLGHPLNFNFFSLLGLFIPLPLVSILLITSPIYLHYSHCLFINIILCTSLLLSSTNLVHHAHSVFSPSAEKVQHFLELTCSDKMSLILLFCI